MLQRLNNDPVLEQIEAIQVGQEGDYWSFKNASRRSGAHALIHYPAMMVPNLQGKLLDAIKIASPTLTSILDPFAGSGTMLVEAMNRGMDFTGIDINPLAVLACQAKSGPYFVDAFEDKLEQLLSRISSDRGRLFFTNFEGRTKWFSDEVALDLSRIARGIEKEPQLWARRLFWLGLAKVVRQTCNSRISTYKLHIKASPVESIPAPLSVLRKVLNGFSANLRWQRDAWAADGLISSGRYKGRVKVELGDSRNLLGKSHARFDIVMTSPPYGDNATTIPYGQYSYLPMMWISPSDVSDNFDGKLLLSTHAIDSASLGGSRKRATERGIELEDKYPAVRSFVSGVAKTTSEYKRFSSFFSDLEQGIDKICLVTANLGYQSWTIGNRRLAGRLVPMEEILMEMLQVRGLTPLGLIRRNIHAKKMAYKNNMSATMNMETVLMAKKMPR